MNNKAPARANVIVLKQILNLIPRGMINRLALETGVEAKSRSFSVVSHLSAMLFPNSPMPWDSTMFVTGCASSPQP